MWLPEAGVEVGMGGGEEDKEREGGEEREKEGDGKE